MKYLGTTSMIWRQQENNMNYVTLHPLIPSNNATLSIPGSKSYTNRALILAALTKHPVQIKNILISDDTSAMIQCLQTLGIQIEKKGEDVLGSIADVQDKEYELNCNLSGTTIRFLLALCCIIPGTKLISGEEGLNKRPIKELVEGLRQLGADISYTDQEGFPPLLVKSATLTEGVTKLQGDISSQYFSALLMIAPIVGNVTIEVLGNQISKPYIDMTLDTIARFGCEIKNESYKKYICSQNQAYNVSEYTVEGDLSSAGYFAAIAALTHSTITLKNINPHSKQADMQFIYLLKQMGSSVIEGVNDVTIVGKGVKPLHVDMENCPDQAQTLAVLAAFASGVTTMTGIRSLRVKETERAIAVCKELEKMGIKTEQTEDTITIYGGNPKPAQIDTYGDHRMAMSFAVAGTILEGMRINNSEVVSKTFPGFWQKLREINVSVKENLC